MSISLILMVIRYKNMANNRKLIGGLVVVFITSLVLFFQNFSSQVVSVPLNNKLPACGVAGQFIPLIEIELSGGAALSGNLVVKNSQGQNLTNYSQLGMGVNINSVTTSAFGAQWYSNSGILLGMKSQINGLANDSSLKTFAVATLTKDDTNQNKLRIAGAIQYTGYRGTIFPLIGTPRRSPNILFTNSTELALYKFADLQNYYITLTGSSTSMNKIDLNNDPAASGIWPKTTIGQLEGSIVYNVLKGYSGPGFINRGGYDYHGMGRATMDSRDFSAGELIGRVVKTASNLQTPVFINLITDGSIGFSNGSSAGSPPIADRGQGSIEMFFVYMPGGLVANPNYFIGWFNASTQNVNTTDNPFGINIEKGMSAAVANYFNTANCSELIDPATGGLLSVSEKSLAIRTGR
jgi:hypothetical protein